MFPSSGKIRLAIATPPGVKPIDVDLDIVKADVPALLGMDVHEREELGAGTIDNRRAHRTQLRMSDGTDCFVDS